MHYSFSLPSLRTSIFLLGFGLSFFLPQQVAYGFRPFDADPMSRVALGGFDPVAYLETGKAVLGAPIFFVEWGGVFWRFATKANQRKFEAEPEKFLPEVGGYCATSLAEDKTVRCDPTEFVVHEGRLFVFGNEAAKAEWLKDPEKYIQEAEAAYQQRLAENPDSAGEIESTERG